MLTHTAEDFISFFLCSKRALQVELCRRGFVRIKAQIVRRVNRFAVDKVNVDANFKRAPACAFENKLLATTVLVVGLPLADLDGVGRECWMQMERHRAHDARLRDANE